ncbi:MAG: AraC family transcriptional regulator [Bacteroidaceae bacterium]|jgi:AraC-like DNA-binding protein|nr:AraC family transcriptional regulator [Bacteroidaceae bacterium]MBQ2186794.1 AraC family transcriptional regulator [Bacteroidaceae bacterium]MBQ2341326.1 AraC family transcriptional regulator [Bacteroidaceae bacterium]MBQ6049174.1 AraC family transcriptional regulator [Bacteroidaceae bacterium]MBQ6084887.1 AraC family transcriptional regulator [Bacteroidaceae bacterium]
MGKYNLTEKKMRAPLYRSLLNPEMVENMYQEIMAKFIVEKKYRDADYNAQKLADELNTNTRYISAVINLRYQDNYSQMVNEFRIKDAMYLLKDKHSQKMTMEEIALTVGFSNRQSFYAAFYKRLGITPREYRQKNMAQIETQLNDRRKRLKESRAKKKQDN